MCKYLHMKRVSFLFVSLLLFIVLPSCSIDGKTVTRTIKTTNTSIISSTDTLKDIYELRMYGIKDEPHEIIIHASVGDMVKFEVNVIGNKVFCSIKDSDGNPVVESSILTYATTFEGGYLPGWGYEAPRTEINTVILQPYPWVYSFKATDELYTFAVNGLPSTTSGIPSVYVKVLVIGSETGTPYTPALTITSSPSITMAREIEIQYELVGVQTYSLLGVGNIKAVQESKEIIISGNIFSAAQEGRWAVTMTAEYYDSSGTLMGTRVLEFIMAVFDDIEFNEFIIKYNENPSQVMKCKLVITAETM